MADLSKYPKLDQTDSQYMNTVNCWRKHNKQSIKLIERITKQQNKKPKKKRSIFRKILDYLKFRH